MVAMQPPSYDDLMRQRDALARAVNQLRADARTAHRLLDDAGIDPMTGAEPGRLAARVRALAARNELLEKRAAFQVQLWPEDNDS
jgi:hypothetical protein